MVQKKQIGSLGNVSYSTKLSKLDVFILSKRKIRTDLTMYLYGKKTAENR